MPSKKETTNPWAPEKPKTIHTVRSDRGISTQEKKARSKAASGLVSETTTEESATENQANALQYERYNEFIELMNPRFHGFEYNLDKLIREIERSEVKPTADQSRRIIEMMEDVMMDTGGSVNFRLKRMIEKFSSAVGIQPEKGGAERRFLTRERKRFSEWKRQDIETQFDRVMNDLVEVSYRTNIHEKIQRVQDMVENPSSHADVLTSEKDTERLKAILPHLHKIAEIETNSRLKLDLLPLGDKQGRDKLTKQANQELNEEYKKMRAEIKTLSEQKHTWLKGQLEQGNLRVWADIREKIVIRPVYSKQEGGMTSLGRAAVERATEAKRAGLYALTEQEKGLEGAEWEEMVRAKRAGVTKYLEAQILSRVVDLGKKINQGNKAKFGNVFKGLFEGSNELSLEKGKNAENKDFLRDVFADTSFMKQLRFESDRSLYHSVIGDEIIKELVKLAKEMFPEEGEMMVANGVDSALVDRLRDDKHSNTNLETRHFRLRHNLEMIGISVPYDELASVKGKDESELRANLNNIDVYEVMEGDYGSGEDSLPELISLFRKHLGDDVTRKKFIDDNFQRLGPEYTEGLRESFGASPELRKSLTKSAVTELMRAGAVDLAWLRNKSKEFEAEAEKQPGKLPGMAEIFKDIVNTTEAADTAIGQAVLLQQIAKEKGLTVEDLLKKLQAG